MSKQRSVKIDTDILDKLAEHGDTPNKAIGNLLGNPKDTLQGNPKVTLGDLNKTFASVESLAELRLKFNSILKELYNKLGLVNKRLDDMEKEFGERINKIISYHIENSIEKLIDNKIKQLRQELTKE